MISEIPSWNPILRNYINYTYHGLFVFYCTSIFQFCDSWRENKERKLNNSNKIRLQIFQGTSSTFSLHSSIFSHTINSCSNSGAMLWNKSFGNWNKMSAMEVAPRSAKSSNRSLSRQWKRERPKQPRAINRNRWKRHNRPERFSESKRWKSAKADSKGSRIIKIDVGRFTRDDEEKKEREREESRVL